MVAMLPPTPLPTPEPEPEVAVPVHAGATLGVRLVPQIVHVDIALREIPITVMTRVVLATAVAEAVVPWILVTASPAPKLLPVVHSIVAVRFHVSGMSTPMIGYVMIPVGTVRGEVHQTTGLPAPARAVTVHKPMTVEQRNHVVLSVARIGPHVALLTFHEPQRTTV